MGRLTQMLRSQIKTASSVDRAASVSGLRATDGAAQAVEFLGVLAIFSIAGWFLYRDLHSIWYFVGLTSLGAASTLLRLYYQAKLGFDAVVEAAKTLDRKKRVPSRGLNGLLEGDLSMDADTTKAAGRLGLSEPDVLPPKE